MKFTPTELPEVILIEPQVYPDARGFFMETYQKAKFSQAGIAVDFVQDNQSGSHRGVLRGLHYQIRQAQGKLVRAVSGEIFDVVVDIRRSSPTFGKWVSAILSAENRNALWVPAGFAHGFLVLSDWADITYKASDFYLPEAERTLLWNDPQLGIDWPLAAGEAPLVAGKDQQGKLLADAECFA
jgi:dTDP-4-dehydrorhamnose 3,5-epimerase